MGGKLNICCRLCSYFLRNYPTNAGISDPSSHTLPGQRDVAGPVPVVFHPQLVAAQQRFWIVQVAKKNTK